MAQDPALQKQIQKMGELVERLEASADPNTRTMAKELLESFMALHGAGLERILEIARESGEAGAKVIEKCGNDELVSSVLLLYGLHPKSLAERVQNAVEKAQSKLAKQGGSAQLISVGEDGLIKVRFNYTAGGCGSSAAQAKATLESVLQDAAPDAAAIVVEESGTGLGMSGIVTVAQLQNAHSLSAQFAAGTNGQRGGD